MSPNKYHAHLDECDQCRNNPFSPCYVGSILLLESVGEAWIALDEIRTKTAEKPEEKEAK